MGHTRKEPVTTKAADWRRTTKVAKKDIRVEESKDADNKKRGR